MAEGAWWQGSPRLIRMELSYQPGGCRSEKRPQLPRESGELVGERPIGARRVGGAVSHQQQLIRQGRRLSPGSACCPDPILTTPPLCLFLSLGSNPGSQMTKLRQQDLEGWRMWWFAEGWRRSRKSALWIFLSESLLLLCILFKVCNFRQSKWLIFFLPASSFEVSLMSSLSAWYYVTINIFKFLVL